MVKNLPANAGDMGFNPWVRKIRWRRKWQPIPVFLPGKQHHPNFLCIFYHFSSSLSVYLYLKPSPYKQDIVVLFLFFALTIIILNGVQQHLFIWLCWVPVVAHGFL